MNTEIEIGAFYTTQVNGVEGWICDIIEKPTEKYPNRKVLRLRTFDLEVRWTSYIPERELEVA